MSGCRTDRRFIQRGQGCASGRCEPVRLVCQDVVGSGAGPTTSGSGQGNLLQHPLELGPVISARRQDEPEGPASSLGDGGNLVVNPPSQTVADLTNLLQADRHFPQYRIDLLRPPLGLL